MQTRAAALGSSLLLLLFLAPTLFGQRPPPSPQRLPAPPVPAGNPITAQKAVLGKILFWDEQLSSSGTVACGTCHLPRLGGGDGRGGRHPGDDGLVGSPDDVFGSSGVVRADADGLHEADRTFELARQVTGRTAPTMIDAAYAPSLFWDGRAEGRFVDPTSGQTVLLQGGALESQAAGPPLSDVEMAHGGRTWTLIEAKLRRVRPLALADRHPNDVQAALAAHPTYADLFANAFGDPTISATRALLAIATYERTLISNQTPFDAWAAGNPIALTQNQRRGFQVFRTNGQCATCHRDPVFSDGSFRNVGLRPNAEDTGRFGVTGNPADSGRFKVPTLRNTGLRPRYMHNGQFTTLEQVVAFYARRGDFRVNQDPVMRNISLSPQDQNALVDFLRNALTDPRVAQGLAPFDRPRLYTERVGEGLPIAAPGGAIGLAPRWIEGNVATVGNTDFKLGLAGVRGGEFAWFGYSAALAPPGTLVGGLPLALELNDPSFGFLPVPVQGVGTSGCATVLAPVPDDPSLSGARLFAQWLVTDSLSPVGAATSPAVEVTIH